MPRGSRGRGATPGREPGRQDDPDWGLDNVDWRVAEQPAAPLEQAPASREPVQLIGGEPDNFRQRRQGGRADGLPPGQDGQQQDRVRVQVQVHCVAERQNGNALRRLGPQGGVARNQKGDQPKRSMAGSRQREATAAAWPQLGS